MQVAAAITNWETRTRVLIVDDDLKLCSLVRDYLGPLGYEIVAAHSGTSGLTLALNQHFDAILLDVILPGLDGFTVLRRLREKSNTPVVMLTGRGEESDRVLGLELGADDYIAKPFSTRELLARLRAVIRRSLGTHGERIVVGTLEIEPAARMARLDGRDLRLTSVEFDLLLSLARAAGRVKTREQLLREVADRHFDVSDRSIDVHISAVRRKLGENSKAPRFIVTIRSTGYMMCRPGVDRIF